MLCGDGVSSGTKREDESVLLARVAELDVLSNVVGGDGEDERVLGLEEEVDKNPEPK